MGRLSELVCRFFCHVRAVKVENEKALLQKCSNLWIIGFQLCQSMIHIESRHHIALVMMDRPCSLLLCPTCVQSTSTRSWPLISIACTLYRYHECRRRPSWILWVTKVSSIRSGSHGLNLDMTFRSSRITWVRGAFWGKLSEGIDQHCQSVVSRENTW